MKVLTIQNFKVYKLIENDGTAYPYNIPNNRDWYPEELIARDTYFSEYNKRHNSEYKNFFWVFSSIIDDNGSIDLNNVDKNLISIISGMVGLKLSEPSSYYAINLEIPNDIILEIDFYDYTDSICDIKQFPMIPEMYNVNKQHRDVQGIIPYIDRKWVTNVMCLSEIIGDADSNSFKLSNLF